VVNFAPELSGSLLDFASSEALIGGFVDIEITEAMPNSLRGTLIHIVDTSTRPSHSAAAKAPAMEPAYYQA
jgi:hypothetical protein